MTTSEPVGHYLQDVRRRMTEHVGRIDVPELRSAAAHLLGLGKLYRPRLFLAAYNAVGGTNVDQFIDIAAAVEILHTSTLIHDDLPSLDDAMLRRGIAAVHLEFGEATAILAGDMLLNLAFRCIVDMPARSEFVLQLVRALSLATSEIMEGQALDVSSEGSSLTVAELVTLHEKKTGALLGACCEMGALAAGVPLEKAVRLRQVGINIGVGFQVRDDLLSFLGTEVHTGKTLSVDAVKDKSTFSRLMGIEAAEEYAAGIQAETRQMIINLELPVPLPLIEMARLAVERDK